MKNNLLVNLIAFIVPICVFSQQCDNETNTHPDHIPSQNYLDVLPINSGNPDTRFLNKWHWWFDHEPTADNSIELNNMGLNPGETYGNVMEHFNDDASPSSCEITSRSLDFIW